MLNIKRILSLFVLSIAILLSNGEKDDSKTKADCVKELKEWCNSTQDFSIGIGFANFFTFGTSGTDFKSSHCTSGSSGTRCFKNLSPWFSCSQDKELTYRGRVLRSDSEDGADDEICEAAKKVNKGFFSGMKLGGGFGKGMKELDDTLSKLQQDMDNFQKSFFKSCFPFCGNDESWLEMYDGKYSVSV